MKRTQSSGKRWEKMGGCTSITRRKARWRSTGNGIFLSSILLLKAWQLGLWVLGHRPLASSVRGGSRTGMVGPPFLFHELTENKEDEDERYGCNWARGSCSVSASVIISTRRSSLGTYVWDRRVIFCSCHIIIPMYIYPRTILQTYIKYIQFTSIWFLWRGGVRCNEGLKYGG